MSWNLQAVIVICMVIVAMLAGAYFGSGGGGSYDGYLIYCTNSEGWKSDSESCDHEARKWRP